MTGRLAGKRIFLTGAAQGIGLAIAQACLREDASLFLIDNNDAQLLETLALLAGGNRLGYAVADISNPVAINDAVKAASADIGPLNALINNAGINVFHRPLDMPDEDWDRCFNANLKGAWNCCKAVLPGMIASGGGVIVNIVSTHSFTIIPHSFPYPLAKHALLGMTKSLALEYAGQGVRVNAIAPGYVETQKVRDWWDGFADPKTARAGTMALHPGGRIAKPEEIANASVFMVSDETPFMNAACLVIDGGLSVLQHG